MVEISEQPRVLITGGSGFIGINLVDYYRQRQWNILSIDRRDTPKGEHRPYLARIDLLNREKLREAFRSFNPHYLVHLAARTDLDETRDLQGYAANMEGVENVLAACAEAQALRRAILTSSMLVCRFGYVPVSDVDYAPNTLYGESKVISERLVRNSPPACSWVITRPTSIWGPWFGAPYRNFFECVMRGYFVHPGRRAGTATYGFVGNTVYQIDALLQAPPEDVQGRVFYLGDDPPLNLSQWADEIAAAVPRKLPVAPYGILKAAARLGDVLNMLGVRPPLTSFRLNNMTADNRLDLSAIVNLAALPPYSRRQGIELTLTWLQDQRRAGVC